MKLSEGAKISNQLVNATLNNPEFTFGFEAEFFYEGIDDFMKSYMTQGSTLDEEEGWYVKKLGDTRWHDVLMFFYPMDVPPTSQLDNLEMMKSRLSNGFEEITEFDQDNDGELPTESEMFATLRSEMNMPSIMALLKIYPYRGMQLTEPQEKSVKSVIQRGDVQKAATLGKLETYNYRTFEDGMVDEGVNIKTGGDDIREIFYEIFSFQLQRYLGEQVMYSSSDETYDQAESGYRYWMVLPDSSLTQEERYTPNIIGIEIISPVMSLAGGLEDMQKIFNIIENPGILGFKNMQGKTTFETGFHINLGLGNKPIDYIKLLMLMGDKHTLEQYGRWTTEHAEPTLASMIFSFNENPARALPIINQFIKKMGVSTNDMSNVINLLRKRVPIDKFQSVNFRKMDQGYIEFRAAGGADYHKDFDKVRNTVLSLAVWMYVATEPEIYKNEYYKALFKFIKSLETGEGEFFDRAYPGKLATARDIEDATNTMLGSDNDEQQQLADSTGWGMHVGPTGRRAMEPTGYMDSMWVPEPENSDGHHPGNSDDDLDLP